MFQSSGKLSVDGYDPKKQNLKVQKRVGFVLNEERSFYWRLTGRQNLLFFGTLDNLHGKKLENIVDELIRLVGLEKAQHKLFASYSSGMKQKLAIARGLISDPKILILDEPTRTLDPISADEISHIISNKIHSEKGKTLLIATHNLNEPTILCNKACFMKNGNIIKYTSIDKLVNSYGSLDNCYKTLIGEKELCENII